MSKKTIREKPWYPMAVAACIAVALYVLLMRFPEIWEAVRHFFNFFRPVILALIIAYLVSPLARFYRTKIFGKIKKAKVRNVLSVTFAFVTVVLLLSFLLWTLIPQLIESIMTFAENLDGYMKSLNEMLHNWGIDIKNLPIDEIISSSENLVATLVKLITDNISAIIATSASAGRQVIEVGIAFLLSIYFLASKDMFQQGTLRLMRASMKEERYVALYRFLSRCHSILNSYIVYNLLDCLIVGVANAVFMAIVGLPYLGLVSFVVAIFNLIPTFGPIIGAVIGAFVLLMVKPWYALAFLIFTVVLQTADAYYIKPKLFGDTLGVAGVWILIGIIVGGRMFGVAGILLAIPAVAILDFSYREYFMPWLEGRKKKRQEEKAGRAAAEEEEKTEEAADTENAAAGPSEND